ncbi:MAG TPA: hypothetical protein VLZ83_04540 [Edaphocola sp.]|nr:hypothetical protein [Edaphocola sp.]
MKKISYFWIVITLISLYQIACNKDNKESMFPAPISCDTSIVTWSEDIQTIVNNSCAISGCHNRLSASNGYILDNYKGVKEIVDNHMFLAVVESGEMPKDGNKLDSCSIAKIRVWINNGALEN